MQLQHSSEEHIYNSVSKIVSGIASTAQLTVYTVYNDFSSNVVTRQNGLQDNSNCSVTKAV